MKATLMLVYHPDNWRPQDLVISVNLGMKDHAKHTNGLEANPMKCDATVLKEFNLKEGL